MGVCGRRVWLGLPSRRVNGALVPHDQRLTVTTEESRLEDLLDRDIVLVPPRRIVEVSIRQVLLSAELSVVEAY